MISKETLKYGLAAGVFTMVLIGLILVLVGATRSGVTAFTFAGILVLILGSFIVWLGYMLARTIRAHHVLHKIVAAKISAT